MLAVMLCQFCLTFLESHAWPQCIAFAWRSPTLGTRRPQPQQFKPGSSTHLVGCARLAAHALQQCLEHACGVARGVLPCEGFITLLQGLQGGLGLRVYTNSWCEPGAF